MESEYVSGLMLVATFVQVETENMVVTGSCKNVYENTKWILYKTKKNYKKIDNTSKIKWKNAE